MQMGNSKAEDDFGAHLRKGSGLTGGARAKGEWEVVCRGPDGNVKWREPFTNLVVNEGLDYLLDIGLNNGTKEGTWYVGLIDGSSPTIAAGDTMSSHSGWSENTNYSEAQRPTWQGGSVSSQSIDNSSNKASYSIDTNSQTIGGAFLVSDNTKGGTSGTLYAAGSFSSSKSADSGDTLEVTATFTQADDGT